MCKKSPSHTHDKMYIELKHIISYKTIKLQLGILPEWAAGTGIFRVLIEYIDWCVNLIIMFIPCDRTA